ncbi:carbohydrate ABC transporter permease [Paenibacillus lignilyticus]|uniref:Carbohydrate ABC transporter permease n=1 Tax=Paenibacillus lignilyticus TaxID=1172615 RepID=A0ABS5CGY6_9BACL|nr:carbohydrate ABC transporter permease [Paenibacillus lignilyticus]MBP3965077.1 carbohydrate ABC transporter permease [Paenibacillus lignilyticus]
MRAGIGEKLLMTAIYGFLIGLGFVTLYPFWNSFVISLNAGADTAFGGITFWPRAFTLDNYVVVLKDGRFMNGFLIAVLRVLVGTVLSIFFTAMLAYGMSRRQVVFKKYYMIFFIITMFFSGGLIPFYMVVRELGMLNTFWVMVVPGIISVWNMIIFRTFFQELPDGLEESAKIDGCTNFGIFFRIVFPVSGPVFATLSLFTAVYHWNDWFNPAIFINNSHLLPVSAVLQQILNSNLAQEMIAQSTGGNAAALDALTRARTVTNKSLSMATMVVATIPIIAVYPFLQKYFVKGVLVGSLKG